jgi:hypothetical protein
MPATSSYSPFQSESDHGVMRRFALVRDAGQPVPETNRVTQGMDLGQFFQKQLQIAQLEDELSRLLQRRKYASPTRTLNNHRAILEATQQLFPKASISVTEESDPEIEDDEYFSVLVQTPGTVDEVVALHREWHNRIRHVAPETASFYCLLLDIND